MAEPPRWKLERLELRCSEGHEFVIDGPDAHDICRPALPCNVERPFVPGEVYMHVSTIRLPMHCPKCEEGRRAAILPPPRLTLIRGGG